MCFFSFFPQTSDVGEADGFVPTAATYNEGNVGTYCLHRHCIFTAVRTSNLKYPQAVKYREMVYG
jgi:hypothetical protein